MVKFFLSIFWKCISHKFLSCKPSWLVGRRICWLYFWDDTPERPFRWHWIKIYWADFYVNFQWDLMFNKVRLWQQLNWTVHVEKMNKVMKRGSPKFDFNWLSSSRRELSSSSNFVTTDQYARFNLYSGPSFHYRPSDF